MRLSWPASLKLRCMVPQCCLAHFPPSALHVDVRGMCDLAHTGLGSTARIQFFSESEAPGRVLSWNAPPAKQPPDAAASYHHEQNRQCDCSRKHCNDCCERKDVHNAIRKCEKHAFPLDAKTPQPPLLAGASWQSGVRS